MKNINKHLKNLNAQIECSLDCGKNAYEELKKIRISDLSPHQHMRLCYLKAKYLLKCFLEEQSIRNLKLAHLESDAIFRLSRKHMAPVSQPKYWFQLIKIKYLLSQFLDNHEQAESYYTTVIYLLGESLDLFPNDQHFHWLKSKIDNQESLY